MPARTKRNTTKSSTTKPSTTPPTPESKPAVLSPVRSVVELEALVTDCGFRWQCNCRNSTHGAPNFKTPYMAYIVPTADADYNRLLPLFRRQIAGCSNEVATYAYSMLQATFDGADMLETHRQLTNHDGDEPYSHRVNEVWSRIQSNCKAGIQQPDKSRIVHPVLFVTSRPPSSGGRNGNDATDSQLAALESKLNFKAQHPSTIH